eukprot:4192507-Amphidinium_carterae.1
MEAIALHHTFLQASLVAASFLENRILSVTSAYPWSLLEGDLHRNIEELLSGPCPLENVSSKVYRLCQRGYNREQV